MLNTLRLENFKAWQKLDISFGRVTGLFGSNSSGKSSLLQFLLMLKQTKNTSDRGLVIDFGGPSNQLVNLGGFKDVVHRHDTNLALSWGLSWSSKDKISLIDSTKNSRQSFASGHDILLQAIISQDTHGLCAEEISYGIGGFRFTLGRKPESRTKFQLNAEASVESDFRFVRNQQRGWPLPGPLKTHLFPDQAKTYYQNADFLGRLESEYESMMDSIYYLGPLREHPKREYTWSGSSPTDVGQCGESTIAAILSATSRKETRNLKSRGRYQPFEKIIAYWLKKLGLIHSFSIKEIGTGSNLYRAIIKRDSTSPEAFLTDVGFGVSQVLPAIVLMYYVPEGSIVIMEQPEIHLHPSVQSGLADIILAVAQHRKVQVIVESHSEHLLRRFQRRVAEGQPSNEDVKLYFCDNNNGRSKLSNLNLNTFGEIENWPNNFFGDEMAEIAETRKAALTRRMESQS